MRNRFAVATAIVFVGTIVITSVIAFKSLESAIIDSQIKEMIDQVQTKSLINDLHYRAAQDLLFAVKNPVFVRYFELPVTMAGDVYNCRINYCKWSDICIHNSR